jgi:two-component system invasion response regulator UvrY
LRNIILIEPQKLVLCGLKYILEKHNICQTIHTVTSGREAMSLATHENIDLMIISTTVDDMSVNALLKKLKRDQPKIVLLILANQLNKVLAKKYLTSGADGYITKKEDETDFINALQKLAQNKRVIPKSIVADEKDLDIEEEGDPFKRLSEREADILLLMIKGKAVKQISDILNLSPKTISTYKGKIFEKLHVNSLIEVFVLASEFGLLNTQACSHA